MVLADLLTDAVSREAKDILLSVLADRLALTGDLCPGPVSVIDLGGIEDPGATMAAMLKQCGLGMN